MIGMRTTTKPANSLNRPMKRHEERDAVDGASRRRQAHRKGEESAARVLRGADVPRQVRELVRLDRLGEELPGFGRLSREEPLEVVGAQIARVGFEEVPHAGDGWRHLRLRLGQD